MFFVVVFQLVEVDEEEEKELNERNQGDKDRKLLTRLSNELHEIDYGNEPSLTPRSNARWASMKSPSSIPFSSPYRQLYFIRNSILPNSPSPASINALHADENSEYEDDEVIDL